MKILLVILSLMASATVHALPNEARPVMVGGDASFDACGGWGIVTATTVLYTVKNGQFTLDQVVEAGQGVYFCDFQEGNLPTSPSYHGIVVPKDENQDCGVSSPIPNGGPYRGPCRSGWVEDSFLDLIAG